MKTVLECKKSKMEKTTTIKEQDLISKMENNVGKCKYFEKNLKRWKSGKQFGFLSLGAFVLVIDGKTEITFDYFKSIYYTNLNQKNKNAYKKQRMERHTMLLHLDNNEIKKMTEFENKFLNTKKNIIKINTLV